MFSKAGPDKYKQALSGIRLKTLAYGEMALLAEFRMEKGSVLPRHTHPNEQTGYLVKGRIRLFIGDEHFEAVPGDSWSIAGNTVHGAEVLEDSVAVEVFAPVRADYLPDETDK